MKTKTTGTLKKFKKEEWVGKPFFDFKTDNQVTIKLL